MKTCSLCNSPDLELLPVAYSRQYFECARCGLIIMDQSYRLSSSEEKARYELHQNCSNDRAYREFLLRALNPLIPKLNSKMRGLDYGSGPNPVASMILGELGFKVANYDPFFAPRNFSEAEKFDFIICIETAEHFFSPTQEFDKINKLLARKGCLALMTEIFEKQISFYEWRYLSDPTHVSLYQPQTLRWIGKKYDWEMGVADKNVRLFWKA